MRKRILMLLMIVLLVTGSFPANAAGMKFSDVKQGSWYYQNVESVVEKGLFQGESATKFLPNAPMTRAMFAQVLANMSPNYEAPGKDEIAYFADVSKTAWYYEPVQWVAKHGVVEGVGNGKFNPNSEITRQEMVTMLFRYAVKTGEVTSSKGDSLNGFADKNKISEWATTAFRWAVTNEIIQGMGNNSLAPRATATRAQVAAMFDKAYGKLECKEMPGVLREIPADPDKDFLRALKMTLDELNQGVAIAPENPNPEVGEPYIYKNFSLFPEISAYYIVNPTANEGNPDWLKVSFEKIFPELVGKTAGEVIGFLGPAATLQGGVFDNPLWIDYETEKYSFQIRIDEATMTAKVDSEVTIYLRKQIMQFPMPADRTFSITAGDVQLASITLPESWKNCFVKKVYDVYEGIPGFLFLEPVQAIRYPQQGGNLLFSITAADEAIDMEMDLSKFIQVTHNEKDYTIMLVKYNSEYAGNDPEVLISGKSMRAEIDDIFNSIKLAEGVTRK